MNHRNLLNLCYFFLLTGCTLLNAPSREAPQVFDLGPPPASVPGAAQPMIAATLLIPPVHASAWLDNNSIHYRLTYEDATRPEAYAQHHWTVAPALMLAERLRARFAQASRGAVTAQDGAKADVALRIELEDFSQSFDSAQSSKGRVRLRASLIEVNSRVLRAQRTFNAERPAAPNAPGAVQALVASTDAAIEELLTWTAQTLKNQEK